MAFPNHIFKAYDIRGLVAGELSKELARKVGVAFARYIKNLHPDVSQKSVVVGYDMRPSSQDFYPSVIEGIRKEGLSIVNIGLTSTPLFNFAVANYPDHIGGIMVTASHNPAEYNGFKMALENGIPVPGNDENLVRMIEGVEMVTSDAQFAQTQVRNFDPFPDYEAKIFGLVKMNEIKPLKIVIDAGNGMGEVTFPKWLKKLPISVEWLYLNPDGNFPNHEANPLKTETLKNLQKKVVETGADFGFALDGDCDRVGLVDEKGEVVPASAVGALIGLEVLKSHSAATMLYDLRSSMVVQEVWEKNGAKTEKCKVGHANIKKNMKEKKAAFASELSLHLYFQDMYDVESSDLCLLYILSILSHEQKHLSEIVKPFHKYTHSGEINFEIEDKMAAIERIKEKYTATAQEISYLDGLWMKFEWGWMSVRASNTESVLRLNLETGDVETTKKMVGEIKNLIEF